MKDIEIEASSGFCFGVVKAIEKAEKGLTDTQKLYCLGDIVHNEAENDRLRQRGLEIIDYETFRTLKNTTVLLRAHGEPPSTYETAKQNNITLIDGTCPIVLKLQQRIKKIKNENPGRQIVVFGKHNHPEVKGLAGQCDDKITVVDSVEEAYEVNLMPPVYLISQTTMPAYHYLEVQKVIKNRVVGMGFDAADFFDCAQSVCGQVSTRREKVAAFAREKDLVIFVAGKNSSNGKQLFETCKQANQNCYFISNIDEMQAAWFTNADKIGICGATSTPQWYMQKVAESIEQLVVQEK